MILDFSFLIAKGGVMLEVKDLKKNLYTSENWDLVAYFPRFSFDRILVPTPWILDQFSSWKNNKPQL